MICSRCGYANNNGPPIRKICIACKNPLVTPLGPRFKWPKFAGWAPEHRRLTARLESAKLSKSSAVNISPMAHNPEKTYQGKPCKRGHSGVRYKTSNACVDCQDGTDKANRERAKQVKNAPKT